MAPAPTSYHGVFPYLVLFEPIRVLGLDLEPVTASSAEPPFDRILPAFRDLRGEPIRAATCFTLRAEPGAETAAARSVQDLVALLGYLLLDPEHPASSPVAENLAAWLFQPMQDRPGAFVAMPNFARHLTFDPREQAIFPPTPDLPALQDHINPDAPALTLMHDPAWTQRASSKARARVLLAMYWYSRTFTTDPLDDDRTKIVHMATAFEVLLQFGMERAKRKSLQGELQKLLGEDPLLAEWASQFYESRSEIVHRGWTADLLFQHPLASRAHTSLVHSGQRILRIATEAELRQRAGGPLARELPGLFYRRFVQPDLEPNEARLTRLHAWRKLRGRAAREFLNLIGQLGFTDASGSVAAVAKVGRRLVRYFMKTCEIDSSGHELLQRVIQTDGDPRRLVEVYRELQAALREGEIAPYPVSGEGDLHLWRTERAVRHFAAYVQHVVPEMIAALGGVAAPARQGN